MEELTNLFDDEDFYDSDDSDLSAKAIFSRDVVVNSTDWTVETMIRQLEKGNINLDPEFQRRSAWDSKKKSKFIESIMLGLPVPQIVLATDKKSPGKFIVIDGKQRLMTLFDFCSSSSERKLKLDRLEFLNDMDGMTYESAKRDSRVAHFIDDFDNQTVRTVVIKNWKYEDYLYLTFLRLNTGSLPLSPQELRQALLPGPFVNWANQITISDNLLQRMLRLNRPDFRMRDVELVIRFFGFRHFFRNYRGNLKTFLDDTCDSLNRHYDSSQIEESYIALRTAFEAGVEVFSSNIFRKYKDGKYESSFNRAVFDVVMYYFSQPGVASAVSRNKPAVEAMFKRLCSEDQNFLSSIETTTKSIGSVDYRFYRFGSELRAIVGDLFEVPRL